ncbi:tetratricopeptide repeat protein [Streptomyces sp. CBMA152]|uniref:tetratricopeptide repeat protein n=1 Tax=Streptomyces sp. CBMA152 TaxID=1896312 RepID=UPI001CB70ADF|nr:tetratricopeptide repeat protein [Streptomyces sp. CBMA152]MBD0747471.1 transcriptional regulator [Streptomyces sp. CBMA152]
MATSTDPSAGRNSARSTTAKGPNTAFRELRGQRSPGEFAAAVRRAAREIGEQVACDARYIGRVEAGEIRCPNYAYERVFRHMFPGLSLTDMGFSARETVRGRGARGGCAVPLPHAKAPEHDDGTIDIDDRNDEESDVLRRAFMTGGSATVAAVSLGLIPETPVAAAPLDSVRVRRVGEAEVNAVEDAVRRIRLLDDRHGADGLYRRAAQPLRTAYALLDAGTARQSTADRLQAGAGELAISVGWLAHDSGRYEEARSHYAEALATARLAGDPALEAHAFCNMSFLARDAGRPREALRAAQAGSRAARQLGSPRLLALLALREAGGWAGLGDRGACEQSLNRAHALFARGAAERDPEWMTFFVEAELEMLEAQCWSALGDWSRAAAHAHRAACVQDPHFTRNLALYRAELADDLARAGAPTESAAAGHQVLDLLTEVQSTRIQAMLADTARILAPHGTCPEVAAFLERRATVTV